MIVTHRIKMELTRSEKTPCIEVVQNDKYSRDLQISLVANGLPFLVPEGTEVMIRYLKPDGKSGIYDLMPDGTQAWDVHENIVTVKLAPQVCNVPGEVAVTVTLVLKEKELSCFGISLHVQKMTPIPMKSDYYEHLSRFLRGRAGTGNAGAYGIPGRDGKSAYAYAIEGGYTGTEEEFAAKLAEENSGFVVQAEEPKNKNVLWLDTDEESEEVVAQSDWNAKEGEPGHVLNRTHWVEKVEIDPYFDNDLTGRTVLPMSTTMSVVKITDYVLSEEECVGAEMTIVMNGTSVTLPITANGVVDVSADLGISCFMVFPDGMQAPFVAVVRKSGTVQGLEVSAGTYYLSGVEDGAPMYTSYFSALDSKEIVHKLDNKFIDAEWMATRIIDGEGEEIFPETTMDEYVELGASDIFVEGMEILVVFNGTKYVCKGWKTPNDNRIHFGNGQLLEDWNSVTNHDLPDTGEPFIMYGDANSGWLLPNLTSGSSYTIAIYKYDETAGKANKLPEEFLPESVDGVVIRSSTAGSTKKFKLTVDDSGTVTATEVT